MCFYLKMRTRSYSEILFDLFGVTYPLETVVKIQFFWDEILSKSNKEVQR